jgi:tripartite-type tricarboxylate transporter receptor subunit TctC
MKAAALIARCLVAGMAVLGAASHTAAQDWPARNVHLIVPYAAGGSGDILARLVAQQLSTSLKQSFVVENRAGAGGITGTKSFISAAPDGYTIGMTNLSTISLAPVINPETSYDPIADFKHIAYIAGSPVVLSTFPGTGIKTLPDFIEYVRKPGNSFSFASSGVGSDGHLFGTAIAAALKIQSVHIPYRATAQALTDMIAGHIQFATFTLSSTAPFLKARSLNGIALTSEARLGDFPDLPTFKELNHPELIGTTWFALAGPPKIPDEIATKINRGVAEAVATPDIQARFQRDGFVAMPMGLDEFKQFIVAENARWRGTIERAGLDRKR